MKFMLEFETAIRLGIYVTKFVGPFDTGNDAREYLNEAGRTWVVPVPKVTLHSIIDPTM